MTIREANHLYTVSYLAFQGNLLQTITQSSLWRPKVDIFAYTQKYLDKDLLKQIELEALKLAEKFSQKIAP